MVAVEPPLEVGLGQLHPDGVEGAPVGQRCPLGGADHVVGGGDDLVEADRSRVIAQSAEGLEARHVFSLAHATPVDSAPWPPTNAPVRAARREAAGLDRVLTLPNGVTLVRLLCIPLFVWLLFGAHRQTAAAVLLAVLGATDWVDGFLARRLHQVSTLGKVLDPAADRILVATAVISIMVYGAVPLWFGIATIAREVLVAGTVLALAALGPGGSTCCGSARPAPSPSCSPTLPSCWGTGPATWQLAVRVVAWGTGGVGLVLAWAAAVMYLVPARRALAEGRAGRRGPQTTGTPATAPGHAMAPGAGEVGT